MNLKQVTITGADDRTSIRALSALSAEFPFVEWGILVSAGREGEPRFPGRAWMEQLVPAASAGSWKVSTHVCGRWVREILDGKVDWSALPASLTVSRRVQINMHAERQFSIEGFLGSLRGIEKEFIFPWDGVNCQAALDAYAAGCKVAALFDNSGGAGRLPDAWPAPLREFWCGYAGGLGPDNVVAQVRKIEAVCGQPYWIDMERGVRTQDAAELDLEAVRSVLRAVANLVGPDGRDVDSGVGKSG